MRKRTPRKVTNKRVYKPVAEVKGPSSRILVAKKKAPFQFPSYRGSLSVKKK